MEYMYTVEYYAALRKKGILPFATTWINLLLSEINSHRRTNTT